MKVTCVILPGNFYRWVPGVGAWGGTCTCPDGQVYNVGDENNACGSLACEHGTPGPCSKEVQQDRAGMQVTCAVRTGDRAVTVSDATAAHEVVVTDDTVYDTPRTTTIDGAHLFSGASLTFNADQTFTGMGTAAFVGSTLTANSAVIFSVRTSFRNARLIVSATLLFAGPMTMSQSNVLLSARPSVLEIVVGATEIQDTKVTGDGSTVYRGAPGHTLKCTRNEWSPAAETLAVGSRSARRLSPSSATLQLCGSQHGALRVPSGWTIVALLNCTASDTAYASAISGLAFASGGLLVLEAVTSSSRPLYVGHLSVPQGLTVQIVTSETSFSSPVSLVVYSSSGGCGIPSDLHAECPVGVACSIASGVDPTDSSLCRIAYAEVGAGSSEAEGDAGALSVGLIALLLASAALFATIIPCVVMLCRKLHMKVVTSQLLHNNALSCNLDHDNPDSMKCSMCPDREMPSPFSGNLRHMAAGLQSPRTAAQRRAPSRSSGLPDTIHLPQAEGVVIGIAPASDNQCDKALQKTGLKPGQGDSGVECPPVTPANNRRNMASPDVGSASHVNGEICVDMDRKR